jgi:hypothetical protein
MTVAPCQTNGRGAARRGFGDTKLDVLLRDLNEAIAA